MKLFAICIVMAACWNAVPGTAAGETRLAPQYQEIAVTLVPEKHLLRGESTLSYAVTPGTIELELDPATRIGGVSRGGVAVSYSFQGGRLTISPGAGGPVPVDIRYELTLNDPLPGTAAGAEDPSYGIRGVIGPGGVFLGSGVAWYPRPPVAPLRRTIRIAAPAGMEGITGGERLSRETSAGISRSVWQEEPPVGEPALSAGPFRIRERLLGGILVSTYLYPDNAHLADSYLDAAGRYLTLFSELFGPYPFPKFAVVENFFPTGYGFPSFTLLGSTVIRLPFMTTTSLPHEIAHSWWGNGVMVDGGQGNWSEGLVTYLADHLLEERKGRDAGRDYRVKLLTDFSLLANGPRDFPLAGFSSRVDPASRAIGYGKGAMVWHMLRRRVGDEAFFAALRDVYRTRLFREAGWGDFTRALVAASGQKLEPFVSPWLEQTGGAQLSLADVTLRREGARWLVSGRVVQSAPLFPLLVPLRLETAGRSFDQTLPLTGGESRFHFLTDTPPLRLLLDPDADVFRLLPESRLPANVNRIKGSGRLLAVATADCGAASGDFRRLLQSIGQGDVRTIREEDLATGAGRGYDLIFCGVPENVAALVELPSGLELGRGGFRVGGERFAAERDLLFFVTRQVSAPGRVGAVFLPLSPGAAEGAATKIGHYGNYDTLVFSGGVNRHKGRIPQEPAGDRVIFPREP